MAKKFPYLRSTGMKTGDGEELFHYVKSEYRSGGRVFRTTSFPFTLKQLMRRRR